MKSVSVIADISANNRLSTQGSIKCPVRINKRSWGKKYKWSGPNSRPDPFRLPVKTGNNLNKRKRGVLRSIFEGILERVL